MVADDDEQRPTPQPGPPEIEWFEGVRWGRRAEGPPPTGADPTRSPRGEAVLAATVGHGPRRRIWRRVVAVAAAMTVIAGGSLAYALTPAEDWDASGPTPPAHTAPVDPTESDPTGPTTARPSPTIAASASPTPAATPTPRATPTVKRTSTPRLSSPSAYASPVVFRAEAENSTNVLTGSASVVEALGASNGRVVANVGATVAGKSPGVLQITNVTVPRQGTYRFSFAYSTLYYRSVRVQIGTAGAAFGLLPTSKCCPMTEVTVELNPGVTSIVFHDASGAGLAVDYVVLSSVG